MKGHRDRRATGPRRAPDTAAALLVCVTILAAAPPLAAQLVADFTATPTSGVQALDVAFTNLSPNGPGFGQLWQFGDGATSSAIHPTHRYDEPGTYTVTLLVTNLTMFESDLEVKTDYISVTPADLTASFAVDVAKGEGPLTVQFTDTSTGAGVTDWLWDFGDGATSTAQHPRHTYGVVEQATQYTVSLTAGVGQVEDTVVLTDLVEVKPEPLGPEQLVGTAAGAYDVTTADLDLDGDLDVVTGANSSDTVAWHENLDGRGTFGPAQVVTTTADRLRTVHADDLDGDGAPDLLVASFGDGRITWHRNDGAGSFTAQPVIFALHQAVVSACTADLDGDGDRDVLAALTDSRAAVWFENTDGLGSFGPLRLVAEEIQGAAVAIAADVDGDGDQDVLFCGHSWVGLAENLDGLGGFAGHVQLPGTVSTPSDVHAADLDRDGDTDVLATSFTGSDVFRFENLDGRGTFGAPVLVSGTAWGAQTVRTADVDGDGDTDVLVAEENDGEVVWHENLDGAGDFGPPKVVTATLTGPKVVEPADLDGDGDTDLLTASFYDSKIAWYENSIVSAPWTLLDGQTSGAGSRPVLLPLGPLTAGSVLELSLEDAPSSTLLLAWLSFTSTPLDALGGTVHAFPPNAQFLRASDANGAWCESVTWPAGIPAGTEFWLQVLAQDGSVPDGITSSNGLLAVTP